MFSFSRPGVYLLATSIKRFNCNIISSHLGLLNSYVKSVHSSAITWCQDDDKNKAQKDKLGGKILLLDSSDTQIGMMTYVEAQRLAMKKNLKLVKLEDPTKRYKQDVYQLLTGLQLHNERMKQRHLKNEMLQAKQFKGDKTIIIRAKITSHDLGIKLKTIQKWITQGFYVRITIHNDLSESAEHIYKEIENSCKEIDGRVLQKTKASDGSTIRCTAQLTKKTTDSPASSEKSDC